MTKTLENECKVKISLMSRSVDEVSIPKGYLLDQPDWDKTVSLFYGRVEGFQRKFIDATRGFVEQLERGEPLDPEALDKTLRSFIWYSKRLSYNKAIFDEKHFHRPVEVTD